MAPAARERARPLLGTIVRIRIADGQGVDGVIDAAFADIADIHRLMSFQEAASDLGRIGRARVGEAVEIDARTQECLSAALEWARRSEGAFDPVAATGCGAAWHDLHVDEGHATVAKPLRVDLSGIAKGYAVDRACAVLADAGITRGVVEAGGDLRVIGDAEEEIALRPGADAPPALVAIADGAVASSDPALSRAQWGGSVHIDGRTGAAVAERFVAVAAPRCIDADALTKIVLAAGDDAAGLLAAAGAIAYRYEDAAWSVLGRPA